MHAAIRPQALPPAIQILYVASSQTERMGLAMKQSEKLEITGIAMKVLPPLIRATGDHTPVSTTAPGKWTLVRQGWMLNLADDVLLSPVEEASTPVVPSKS